MPTSKAGNAKVLRKRIGRFLELSTLPDRRRLVLDVLPRFSDLGPTAIIGGMLRDLARAGPSGYSSDIDLVVDPYDAPTFRKAMKELGGVENRFGGFGLQISDWKVDAWALGDTWAHTAGLQTVKCFADLVHCTFFDWDGIAYELRTSQLHVLDGYFERLQSGILGINLKDNPNPAGSAVRALRRSILWSVRLSEELRQFVLQIINEESWEALVELDRKAFDKALLNRLDPILVSDALREGLESGENVHLLRSAESGLQHSHNTSGSASSLL